MPQTPLRNLKTLFELRKTLPLQKRMGIARLFQIEGQYGLSDATGMLWPVKLTAAPKHPLKEGEVITFTCVVTIENKQGATKYDDDGYLVCLDTLLATQESLEPWRIDHIPAPLPQNESIREALKQHSYNSFTKFFPSPTSVRFKKIQQKNMALERTIDFFCARGFLKIETPTLVPSGGMESYLSTFATSYEDFHGKKWALELPTSPEFALKKILTEGAEKVFQVAKAFRNRGEVSDWHEPEFFMLEWYRMGGSLLEIMHDTKNLVLSLAKYLGSTLEIPEEWPLYTVNELFQKLLHLDLETLQNRDDFFQKARGLSPSIVEGDDWDSLFCKLFMEKIEPYLKEQKACFVTEYPIQMAALAQQVGQKPFAQRCEAFLYGIEICNGYQELTDSRELEKRVVKIEKGVARDVVFEHTMRYGLPPCSGNALGIERVISLLLGASTIREYLPLPFCSQLEVLHEG